MQPAVDCSCGHQLQAASDEELFRAARQQIVDHHTEMQRTNDRLAR